MENETLSCHWMYCLGRLRSKMNLSQEACLIYMLIPSEEREIYVMGGCFLKQDNIFITGYAKLPKGITASQLYGGEVVIGVIVNRYSGEIQDIECSFVTDTAKKYAKELLIRKNLNDIEGIVSDIEDNYFGMAKKSFIAVLINCYERYKMIVKKVKKKS